MWESWLIVSEQQRDILLFAFLLKSVSIKLRYIIHVKSI